MTDDVMSLRALAEKSEDTDVLREVIGFCRATSVGTGGG